MNSRDAIDAIERLTKAALADLQGRLSAQFAAIFTMATLAFAGIVGVFFLCSWCRRRTPWKMVPRKVEEVASALLSDESIDELERIVDEDGRPLRRIGVPLRLANEVKLRFGGTPELTEANRLVAARYIREAMEAAGITRKTDQWNLLPTVRALVFTKLAKERFEDQLLNSKVLQGEHNNASGWWTDGTSWGGGLHSRRTAARA